MGSSGEHSDSAIPTGGPSMNVRLAFALLPLLLLGSPVYAQSSCSECLKAAEKDFKKCLEWNKSGRESLYRCAKYGA